MGSMLIISSLESAHQAFKAHQPTAVISLLSEDEAVPSFPEIDARHHLKLYVEQESCAVAIDAAAKQRADELISFARTAAASGKPEKFLIHCKRGISRSTAAAFIILCTYLPDSDEEALMKLIRNAAPHADPCPLFVNYADEILERDGRMLDAVEDLGPPVTVLTAPAATVPIAA